jgi:type VI secretion system protein ImpL
MLRTLRQDATNLPSPFYGIVTQIALNAGGSVGAEATRELDQLYRDQVVAECRTRVEDRYPFGDGHAGDMSLSDFSLVFGYGGVYDKFFSEHLEKLVNTSQRPWTWRPDSVHLPLAFLGQFERASGIRQMFFDAGTKALQLGFTATLSKLDATATRFYVDIDSQRFEAKPDIPMAWQAVWPGGKTGNALAMFEDRVAQPEAVLNIGGPWAFFKMIDETIVPQRDATGGVTLSLQTRYHRGVVRIDPAGGSAVPYATRDWRQFGCGS